MADNDELAEIDLVQGAGTGPLLEQRRRWPVVLVVAAVGAALLAIAGVMAADGGLVSTGGETSVSDREQGAGTPEKTPVATSDTRPDTIEGYGPYGWPLDVSPGAGLVDQQVLAVAGAEFPATTTVGLVVCRSELIDSRGQGPAHCDRRMLGGINTDASGSFSTEVQVPRVIHLRSGEWVDCAAAPTNGHGTACVLAAGIGWESGLGGLADLNFDPDVDAIQPPALIVEPTTGLVDGQEIVIRVTSANAVHQVEARFCTRDSWDHGVCHLFEDDEWQWIDGASGPEWVLRAPIPRVLDHHLDERFDCADEATVCELEVHADWWSLAPVTMEFDPT